MVGWAIVRSNVALEGVKVALGVDEDVVRDVGSVDATVGHD